MQLAKVWPISHCPSWGGARCGSTPCLLARNARQRTSVRESQTRCAAMAMQKERVNDDLHWDKSAMKLLSWGLSMMVESAEREWCCHITNVEICSFYVIRMCQHLGNLWDLWLDREEDHSGKVWGLVVPLLDMKCRIRSRRARGVMMTSMGWCTWLLLYVIT
jgi:hypothetical protein